MSNVTIRIWTLTEANTEYGVVSNKALAGYVRGTLGNEAVVEGVKVSNETAVALGKKLGAIISAADFDVDIELTVEVEADPVFSYRGTKFEIVGDVMLVSNEAGAAKCSSKNPSSRPEAYSQNAEFTRVGRAVGLSRAIIAYGWKNARS